MALNTPRVIPQSGQGRPNQRRDAHVRQHSGSRCPNLCINKGSARQYSIRPSTAMFTAR